MINFNLDKLQIVYIMQLPQKIDRRDIQLQLVRNFPEIGASSFAALPEIDDADFPKVLLQSQNININITSIRYDFSFTVDSSLDVFGFIINKLKSIENCFVQSLEGPIRMGIVLYGSFLDLQSYSKTMMEMGNIIDEKWSEVECSVRELKEKTIEDKNYRMNVWRRFSYDKTNNQNSIILDINTINLDYVEKDIILPSKLYTDAMSSVLEECIYGIK